MKRIVAILVLAVLCVISLVVWKMQPWMPAGRAVRIKSEHFGGYEFEVWQRKNDSFGEPFATGLFVRDGTNAWRVFLFDFQDMYHPRITLQHEGSTIVVLHGKERLGALDGQAQNFTRKPDGAAFQAAIIGRERPGNWWLR
jgi:hypothetical protein